MSWLGIDVACGVAQFEGVAGYGNQDVVAVFSVSRLPLLGLLSERSWYI
jgi:hypothetical protein